MKSVFDETKKLGNFIIIKKGIIYNTVKKEWSFVTKRKKVKRKLFTIEEVSFYRKKKKPIIFLI